MWGILEREILYEKGEFIIFSSAFSIFLGEKKKKKSSKDVKRKYSLKKI